VTGVSDFATSLSDVRHRRTSEDCDKIPVRDCSPIFYTQWLIIILFQEENPPAESGETPSSTADGQQTEGSSEAESASQIEEGPAEAGGQRMDTLDDNKPPGDD
jgi:hypothetical protein